MDTENMTLRGETRLGGKWRWVLRRATIFSIQNVRIHACKNVANYSFQDMSRSSRLILMICMIEFVIILEWSIPCKQLLRAKSGIFNVHTPPLRNHSNRAIKRLSKSEKWKMDSTKTCKCRMSRFLRGLFEHQEGINRQSKFLWRNVFLTVG
jgi:hypothetical protein